jgi:hypothetical protein
VSPDLEIEISSPDRAKLRVDGSTTALGETIKWIRPAKVPIATSICM